MTVTGSVDFRTQIFPTLNSQGTVCASCHGQGGAYYNFLPAENLSPTNATVAAFYDMICVATAGPCQVVTLPAVANGTGGAPGGSLVSVASPSSSLLYSEPNQPTDTTMPKDASFATIVLQWINEGAYCTTTGATCPP